MNFEGGFSPQGLKFCRVLAAKIMSRRDLQMLKSSEKSGSAGWALGMFPCKNLKDKKYFHKLKIRVQRFYFTGFIHSFRCHKRMKINAPRRRKGRTRRWVISRDYYPIIVGLVSEIQSE